MVRCRCGNVFEAALDLEDAAPADDFTYDLGRDDDLAPQAGAQPQRASPSAGATNAPADSLGAYPQRRSDVLTYAHARPGELEQKRAVSPLLDWYLPIGIVAVAACCWAGQVVFESQAGAASSAGKLIGGAIVAVVLNIVLTLLAVAVSAKLMSIDFGPIPELVLKVAATAVLGGAVGALTVSIFPKDEMNGPIIALHVVVILYWVLFYTFFEVDLQECLMTVAIVTAFHTAGFCILFKPLG